MAQWLKGLAPLSEELNSIASNHTVAQEHLQLQLYGTSTPSSGLLERCTHTHIYLHMNK